METVASIRERIKNRPHRAWREPYELPEWGAGLYAKTLSGPERAEFEMRSDQYEHLPEKLRVIWHAAEIVAACTVTDAGDKVFGPDDVAWLVNEDADLLLRLGDIAGRLNQLRDKDLEEARKNS